MSEQSVQDAGAGQVAAENSEQVQPEVKPETAETTAPEVTENEESKSPDIKTALEAFGHDLSAVWGDVEAVFAVVGGDFDDVAKKSLELIEHPAAKAYDAVKALLSHKQ